MSSVHVPGLRKMPDIEIVAVANRSLESNQRAAAELGIPRAYADWQQLLAAGGIDAVLIGTWRTCIARSRSRHADSGRHVLCQARMANDSAEARDMLAASQRHSISSALPRLRHVRNRSRDSELARGRTSRRRAVRQCKCCSATSRASAASSTGNHDAEFSGINVLNVGGTYESAMRWLGPAIKDGQQRVQIPTRKDERGESAPRRSRITWKCSTSSRAARPCT